MDTTTPTHEQPKLSARRRHPLIVATEHALMSKKPGEYGLAYTHSPEALDVSVGRENTRRALGIMDALIKRVEKAGGRVTTEKERPWKTVIKLDGMSLQVKMTKRTNRSEHVPSAKEQEELKKGRSWAVPKWDFTPNGDLVFEIVDWCGTGQQRTWMDGSRRKFSSTPDRLFEAYRKAVAARKVQEEEWEAERRRREEVQERAAEERREKEEDDRRFAELVRRTTGFDECLRVRHLLVAFREKPLADGAIEPGSDLVDWFVWAERRADAVDPLENTVKELSGLDRSAVPTPASSSPPQSPP